MQYSADDMLFALAAMGIKVQQANIPAHRLGRKLTLALEHSQRIPELLKGKGDDTAVKSEPHPESTSGGDDEDDEDEPVRGKVDPSKLPTWSSVSQTPLVEVSSHTNISEALTRMRFKARKLGVAMRDKALTAPGSEDRDGDDPFPLFTNEFMDLRQSVLAVALRYDLGLKFGMFEDEGKTFRIVFRVCHCSLSCKCIRLMASFKDS